MISFRYHLVSIVAVFLALALGIVMGTTVIKQGLIDSLRNRADGALNETHALEAQVTQLQKDLNTWDRFSHSVQPMLVAGQLAGTHTVIVTQQGVDASEVDGVRNVLSADGQAGATVVGILEITQKMGLTDPSAKADLAQILGASSSASSAAVAGQAAQALANRLATGPTSSENDPNDVLRQLVRTGFLAMRQGSPAEIGGADQAVVLLSGGQGQPSVDPGSFLVPLATGLVAASRPVVAAETADSSYAFVPTLRTDSSVDGRLVTIDDADTMIGRVALVLGLHGLLVAGTGGDYGVSCGSCQLLPTPRT